MLNALSTLAEQNVHGVKTKCFDIVLKTVNFVPKSDV
jgi:hypothetical protein